MDKKENPPVAFAVQAEESKRKTLDSIAPLNVIRNLSCEQICELLNRRYGLELETGVRCISPLRDEASNPTSFVLYDDAKWSDYGASDENCSHGDVIDFVRIREGIDFIAAVKIIAADLGLDASDINGSGIVEINLQRQEKKTFLDELELVVQYTEHQLATRIKIRNLVLARGLTDEFIRQHRIGFLDSADCYRRWAEERYPDIILRLDLPNLDGRITIPYFDASGTRIIYLIGRAL